MSKEAALPLSAPKKVDGDWQDKIRKAAEARQAAKQMRRDKPTSFRGGVGRQAR